MRNTGIIAIDILEGDDLHGVALSDGKSEIFIGTHDGRAIRFNEEDVRPMGRGAAGVKGITLRPGDFVVEMDVLQAGNEAPAAADEPEVETDAEAPLIADERGYLLTVTEKGFGKRSPVSSYSGESRRARRFPFRTICYRATDGRGRGHPA